MGLYQVMGTVRYDIDLIIQAKDEEDAIRYFEDFAAIEEINGTGALEDIEVDDVLELETDEEPDYITIDGADDEDEEDDL